MKSLALERVRISTSKGCGTFRKASCQSSCQQDVWEATLPQQKAWWATSPIWPPDLGLTKRNLGKGSVGWTICMLQDPVQSFGECARHKCDREIIRISMSHNTSGSTGSISASYRNPTAPSDKLIHAIQALLISCSVSLSLSLVLLSICLMPFWCCCQALGLPWTYIWLPHRPSGSLQHGGLGQQFQTS